MFDGSMDFSRENRENFFSCRERIVFMKERLVLDRFLQAFAATLCGWDLEQLGLHQCQGRWCSVASTFPTHKKKSELPIPIPNPYSIPSPNPNPNPNPWHPHPPRCQGASTAAPLASPATAPDVAPRHPKSHSRYHRPRQTLVEGVTWHGST